MKRLLAICFASLLTGASAAPLPVESTALVVSGSMTLDGTGGRHVPGLTLADGARLVYDPVRMAIRVSKPPEFGVGAKLALASRYANFTSGRFLMMTWDAGDLDEAHLATLFDSSSAKGRNPRLTIETAGEQRRLWLDLDAGGEKGRRVTVLPIGDSITQGSMDKWGNWRIAYMKRLAAANYDERAVGFWKIESHDICDAPMPGNWIWHSGISGQRICQTKNGTGDDYALDNLIEQAGDDVDVVLFKLATNDLNGDGKTAEALFPSWSNLVAKIVQRLPRTKVVCATILHIPDSAHNAEAEKLNAKIKACIANGGFPEHQVYVADLNKVCPRYDASGAYTGNFLSQTNLHPTWKGEELIADEYVRVTELALADGEIEAEPAPVPTVSGVYENVPARYLNGFRRARVLDVTRLSSPMTVGGEVPYEDASREFGPVKGIRRVGYYVELKRKNTALIDYHERVRWIWVDMDAFGATVKSEGYTLADVGVPLEAAVKQKVVPHLHVISNMPGVREIAPTDDSVSAFVEFWPNSYTTDAGSVSGAPKHIYGYDWNNKVGTGVWGSMQVHRILKGEAYPAEVLFAFNRFTRDGTPPFEIGIGPFAVKAINSTDWTDTKGYATMNSDAYEIARIEIWTQGDPEPPAMAASEPIRVCSFNIRYNNSSDTGVKNWSDRRSTVAKVIRETINPDIFGLQEVTPGQRTYLEEKLADWAIVGDHRDSNRTSGEASPIGYRKSRFNLISTSTFWLSETPDSPGSKSWNTSVQRICTYAILRDRLDGRLLCFANTHMDHKSALARLNGMKLILNRVVRSIGEKMPVILSGDHNCLETADPAKEASKVMNNALYASETPAKGLWRTVVINSDWTVPEREWMATEVIASTTPEERNSDAGINRIGGKRIDYLYVTPGIVVADYETVAFPRGGNPNVYCSDHFPVTATLYPFPGGDASVVGEIEKGTNFTSAVATVKANVYNLGEQANASLAITLFGPDGSEVTRTHALSQLGEATFTEAFDGLVRGGHYVLALRLCVGEHALYRSRSFVAGKETTLFLSEPATVIEPEPVEVPNEEILVRGAMDGYLTLGEIPPLVEGAKAGVTFLDRRTADEVVIWDGEAWRPTGAVLEPEESCEIGVALDATAGEVVYRMHRMTGGWVSLGSASIVGTDPVQSVTVTNEAGVIAIEGRTVDSNLIRTSSGEEFGDLETALAIGAEGPFEPLWQTSVALPTDRLGVLPVSDPHHWFSFAGGANLLRRETVGGKTFLYYGAIDPEAAARSQYLRISCELGLSGLLADDTPVVIRELNTEPAGGAFAFALDIGEDRVTSKRVAEFVQLTTNLTSATGWHTPRPPAESSAVRDGRIEVQADPSSPRAFLRIRIPADSDLQ